MAGWQAQPETVSLKPKGGSAAAVALSATVCGLNGFYFGSCTVDYDPGSFTKEEMEGFTFMTGANTDGELSYIHVLILNNDIRSEGDIRIIHFTTPYPELI